MTDLDPVSAVSSLDDPVRRRLYEVVCERTEPVGRDEAAAAAGVGRALAVYHLDKLVEAGLLTASYQRPPGRSGPGAGRPAKVYARSGREFAVTVPPREYELAARLLVQAVESDPSGRSRVALLGAARRLGSELGAEFHGDGEDELVGALAGQGYEPRRGEDGVIRLRNCPFRQLAEHHRDIVCGMNLGLIEGITAGLAAAGVPVFDPQPGRCCVAIGQRR
jgi:predicted ArsR family transcriptional regulator